MGIDRGVMLLFCLPIATTTWHNVLRSVPDDETEQDHFLDLIGDFVNEPSVWSDGGTLYVGITGMTHWLEDEVDVSVEDTYRMLKHSPEELVAVYSDLLMHRARAHAWTPAQHNVILWLHDLCHKDGWGWRVITLEH